MTNYLSKLTSLNEKLNDNREKADNIIIQLKENSAKIKIDKLGIALSILIKQQAHVMKLQNDLIKELFDSKNNPEMTNLLNGLFGERR